jgi:hypothetical protein
MSEIKPYVGLCELCDYYGPLVKVLIIGQPAQGWCVKCVQEHQKETATKE